jgi:hypothetical protein
MEVISCFLSHLRSCFFGGGFGSVVLAGLLVSSAVLFDAGGKLCDDVHDLFPIVSAELRPCVNNSKLFTFVQLFVD